MSGSLRFDKELKLPLPRITYDDAMLKYGCDAPDLRFDLEIVKESLAPISVR